MLQFNRDVTADQFSDFFVDKVVQIRHATADAPPPVFPNISRRCAAFESVTIYEFFLHIFAHQCLVLIQTTKPENVIFQRYRHKHKHLYRIRKVTQRGLKWHVTHTYSSLVARVIMITNHKCISFFGWRVRIIKCYLCITNASLNTQYTQLKLVTTSQRCS
jgi:hypothetical protein